MSGDTSQRRLCGNLEKQVLSDVKQSTVSVAGDKGSLLFFFFCLFAISRAAPSPYAGSQARG